MTAAHDYEDLHRLVDRLTPVQAHELRDHALRLIDEDEQEEPTSETRSVPRELSFIGIIHAEPDLAERSEDILRQGFGH
ncbi:hypothetical protein [Actinomadura sp. DC4]|uniref:hypothetical protein n=1 Tax=Actinomadura sp. DC4 TaxID=3055069 RepID=UPI0025B01545|nr:hypothetical protein [Actinomadura sp. DC4]MDN3359946.1 hypothetical protein [Actinomadura sp. DC4]